MTMKHAIAFSLTLTVAGAMPPGASAQFDLDLQATEIGNQVQEIVNRVTRYTTLLNQFTSLDCSAQGMASGAEATPINEAVVVCDTLKMLGAFTDSYQQLLAAPTDLLNTPVPLPDWRDLLQASDTVDEAGIRNVYRSGPMPPMPPLRASSGNGTTQTAVWSSHMPRPMPPPRSPTRSTRPNVLLRILKRATASPVPALRKRSSPRRSPAPV